MSNVNANMDHGHNTVDQKDGLLSQNATASNCNGNNNNNGFSGVSSNDSANRNNDGDSGNMTGSNNMSSSANTSGSQMSAAMSNSTPNSIPTFSSSNNGADDVCRDFLRNVCRRGKACRFKHPDPNETEALGQRKDTYVFCHDYQNRECRRENCRFLHCSKQEEEVFRNTGKLPSHVQAQIATDEWNSTPVCKDFMNGTCRRQPGRCKFRHPPEQSPMKRNSYNGRSSGFGASPPGIDYQTPYGQQNSATNMMSNYGYADNYPDTNPNKRKRYESMYTTQNGPYTSSYTESMRAYGMQTPNQAYYQPRGQPIDSRSYLEEENAALRRRIDELKKQVAELCTTNDYLMEQINQMRSATTPAAVAAVAAATSVASLQAPAPGTITSTATVIGTAPSAVHLQAAAVAPPPPPAAAVIGALPPSSIVSSIASISLPTVTAPVSLVNSSAAASLASYTPALHSTTPWPLGVDQ